MACRRAVERPGVRADRPRASTSRAPAPPSRTPSSTVTTSRCRPASATRSPSSSGQPQVPHGGRHPHALQHAGGLLGGLGRLADSGDADVTPDRGAGHAGRCRRRRPGPPARCRWASATRKARSPPGLDQHGPRGRRRTGCEHGHARLRVRPSRARSRTPWWGRPVRPGNPREVDGQHHRQLMEPHVQVDLVERPVVNDE